MNPRIALAAFALAATTALPSLARKAEAPPQHLAAQQVIHLLDYVSSDYGKAVQGGQVVNAQELNEHLDVLAEAARVAATLDVPAASRAFRPLLAIEAVRRLVDAHAPEADVAAAIRQTRNDMLAFFDVAEAPRDLPSHERGRLLFEQHCAACHGSDGRANTPRAVQYSPRPANFHAEDVARALSPLRVFTTVRFGVPNTAMVPFDFLSVPERWDVAFYVSQLDHQGHAERRAEDGAFALGELAAESDDELRADLRSSGVPEADVEPALTSLRLHAPYEPSSLQPKGTAGIVLRARAALSKVARQVRRGDRSGAKTALLATYLDVVEPIEVPLRAADPALMRDIEARFKDLRIDIDRSSEIDTKIEQLRGQLAHAGRTLDASGAKPSFATTLVSSAGIALREGVEAALLIAALLAVVGRSGPPERKRWVHLGWATALALGAATWLASQQLVAVSGMSRETLEGASAILAALVLFYVSYWLFAKREAARWVSYLRDKAKSGNAAWSLFGISFVAVYREAFETIIFYQALISQPGSGPAAALGAVVGGALLVGLVVFYGRAGKFAPPQSFFAFSGMLLYGLAVVFAGQGIAALQTTGHLPLHPVALPHLPALGVYPTIETYGVQLALVTLALAAALLLRSQRTRPTPPGASGPVTGSREGAKL
ncbi:MAG TPA: FTR1 family protein [Polyangiaceae bacterium]|nr:FTR1 family protein [Polyangiaceae bacterium]